VVKANVYLKDMATLRHERGVRAYFGRESGPLPARTTVEAARLPKDVLVEIEMIAEV